MSLIKKITKKVEYQIQNLITKKKTDFYKTHRRQKMNKPKELRKTLKPIGSPSKAVTASNICLKGKNGKAFERTKKCFIFKNSFSSLVQNLVSKLPPRYDIFTESKVASYYDNTAVPKDLNLQF